MPEPTGHTVIILGAGASADYGLPIGSGLRKWILEHAHDEIFRLFDPIRTQNGRTRGTATHARDEMLSSKLRQEINSFVDQFGRVGEETIDEFLSNNPQHARYGRVAITACLLKSQDSALKRRDYTGGCYKTICRAIESIHPNPLSDRLRVINFNYDRTFPMIISTMLAFGRHKGNPDHHCSLLDSISAHPYGTLRLNYKFDSQTQRFRREYQCGYGDDEYEDLSDCNRAFEGVQIIQRQEAKEIADQFAKAQEWLATARSVYFLGFGYDPTNLSRLGFDGKKQPCQNTRCTIHATMFGLRQERRHEVIQLLSNSHVSNSSLRLGEAGEKCYDFLTRLGGITL